MGRNKPNNRAKRSESRRLRRSLLDVYTPAATIDPKDIPKDAYAPPPSASGSSGSGSGDE